MFPSPFTYPQVQWSILFVYVIFDHTAYKAVFAEKVYAVLGLYEAVVAVELVLHPKKLYPARVGVVLLNVILGLLYLDVLDDH